MKGLTGLVIVTVTYFIIISWPTSGKQTALHLGCFLAVTTEWLNRENTFYIFYFAVNTVSFDDFASMLVAPRPHSSPEHLALSPVSTRTYF